MPNLGKQWEARLSDVRSVDELRKALVTLGNQGREFRSQVRKEVNEQVVDGVADRVEAATEGGLRDVLHALYGPDLEDLHGDKDARQHAKRLIRKSRSGQLARVLGLAASGIGGQEITNAALARWDSGYAKPRRLKPQRIGKSQAVVVDNKPLLVVALVVVLAVLSGVFVLGYVTGQPESAQSLPVTTEATPTAAPPPSSPSPPAGRTIRVTTVDPSRTLYAFVRVGEQYVPQQPCTKEEDGAGGLWRCAPSREQVEKPELVAVEVPSADLRRLADLAAAGRKIVLEDGWGTPVVVP